LNREKQEVDRATENKSTLILREGKNSKETRSKKIIPQNYEIKEESSGKTGNLRARKKKKFNKGEFRT